MPYPLYGLVSFMLLALVVGSGHGKYSWAHIGVMFIANIGGLLLFYVLFRKSKKEEEALMGESDE